MASAVILRADYSASELRRLAVRAAGCFRWLRLWTA